jgi:hypothetical protein
MFCAVTAIGRPLDLNYGPFCAFWPGYLLIDRLRSVPGDLFIPFHTYYGALVGKRTFVHRMGVRDVEAALGRPAGLDQALQEQAFSAIVLDWKALPGEFPFVDSRYHLYWPLREGVDSVRMFAGAATSPSALLVPTIAGHSQWPWPRRQLTRAAC